MTKLLTAVAAAALLLSAAPTLVRAQETSSPATLSSDSSDTSGTAGKKHKGKKHKGQEQAGKDVGNKKCPVSGEAIGSMGEGASVVYKGEKVNLCCSACKEKFNANPEEYLKKAHESK